MDFSAKGAGNSGLFPNCLMKKTTKRALKNPKLRSCEAENNFIRKFKQLLIFI